MLLILALQGCCCQAQQMQDGTAATERDRTMLFSGSQIWCLLVRIKIILYLQIHSFTLLFLLLHRSLFLALAVLWNHVSPGIDATWRNTYLTQDVQHHWLWRPLFATRNLLGQL